ncbi:uncharacterized protein [Coffea arabica]|uniref:Uncharacterized protein n=1 Tax=Coffea arabica TaxID=13443 RepID=A0ABM4V9J3_COFAR
MGFCDKWVSWISRCLETVSYSFNCNGEVKGFVKPGRGIRADVQQAKKLMKILQDYEQASGQLINLEKSSVFFSKNLTCRQKQEICSALGGMAEVKQGKYLGLPMVISRTKEQIFCYIRDNIKMRLESWKNKLLSPAGKEVMLKAVTMAMPTYVMSCFKLPRKLLKDINSAMANYW